MHDTQPYSTDKMIKDGAAHLRRSLKTFIKRSNDKHTEHKIRKKILSWANTKLITIPKEERIKIAHGVLMEFMTINEGYNAASEKDQAKKRQIKAMANEPKEVVAEIGGEEIQLSIK